MWKEYLVPSSIAEALRLLNEYRGESRIIAGGTDLVLQSSRSQCTAPVIIDITRIPGLDYISEKDDFIVIGCQATHADIVKSPVIREKSEILALACENVGGPATRNVGTLVGNVVNALPAADGAVALFALNSELEITEQEGKFWIPISDFYAGVGACVLECGQLVTAIRFRSLEPGQAGAYHRLSNRKAVALPSLAVGVVVGVKSGVCSALRISVGPVALTPFRAKEAEKSLIGTRLTQEHISRAAELAKKNVQPRDSLLRGSREYRQSMVGVLTGRAITEAVKKAQAKEG